MSDSRGAPPPHAPPETGAFAEELKRLRMGRGLSQAAAARSAQLTSAYYSQLEAGVRPAPPPQTVDLLCAGLSLAAKEARQLRQIADEQRLLRRQQHPVGRPPNVPPFLRVPEPVRKNALRHLLVEGGISRERLAQEEAALRLCIEDSHLCPDLLSLALALPLLGQARFFDDLLKLASPDTAQVVRRSLEVMQGTAPARGPKT